MFIDGKKYACDACVRGHRVSGCNHSDRPLQEIAKKGRPVSQCQHCRTMRKSRSAHVKCDCGDKAKGPVKHHYINESGKLVEMPESMEKLDMKTCNNCNCSGGGRCVCSIKKENLDPVPEFSSTPRSAVPKEVLRKPMLQSTQSETCLTKFANGHHRPIHRHNSHQNSTAPYHIPHHNMEKERPLSQTALRNVATPDLMAAQQGPARLIKSEHNSPGLKSVPNTLKDQPNLLRSISDFNLASANRGMSGLQLRGPDLSIRTDFPTFDQANFSATQEYFMSAAEQQTPSYAQAPPNTAVWPETTQAELFDLPPGLTQSVSGDDSELGDFNLAAATSLSPVHNLSPNYMNGPLSPESSDVCESDGYGISAQSSIIGMSSLAQPPTSDNMGGVNDLYSAPLSMDVLGGYDSARHSPLGYDSSKQTGLQDADPFVNSARNSLQFQDSDFLMMMPFVASQNIRNPQFEFRS